MLSNLETFLLENHGEKIERVENENDPEKNKPSVEIQFT
jgi:hypothetical protein